MTAWFRALRRRRDRGALAAEFALSAPIVVFVTFAVLDFGNTLQQVIRLEAAARAGAQVAFSNPANTAAVSTAVRNSLQFWPLTTDSPAGNVAVTVTNACLCPTSTTTFDCTTGDPEATCGGTDFRQYVSVTVARPYNALFIAPFTTLRGNVEVRLR